MDKTRMGVRRDPTRPRPPRARTHRPPPGRPQTSSPATPSTTLTLSSREVAAAISDTLDQLPVIAVAPDDVIAFLQGDVMDAVRARNVPAENLAAPRLDLLVPALEAVRYSSIRSAFASLIASAMDRSIANSVLPAYVEVLKQLSADELRLLAAVPAPGRVFALSDLAFELPSRELIIAYRHIVPAHIAAACSLKPNIPQYIDNALRLNLIHKPLGQSADAQSYRAFSRMGFVRDICDQVPGSPRTVIDRGAGGITNFGEQFRRACISPQADRAPA